MQEERDGRLKNDSSCRFIFPKLDSPSCCIFFCFFKNIIGQSVLISIRNSKPKHSERNSTTLGLKARHSFKLTVTAIAIAVIDCVRLRRVY